MELNIKVKIESPDILNGLLALADEISKASITLKTVVNADNANVTEDNSKIESPRVITLEEVRAKLTSLSQCGKQAEVKEIIKKFGASKLTDIPKDKYEELLKAAEAI